MTQNIENLKEILANSYYLSLKTQNYHWNITGANFKSLHELFGEQYAEIIAAIDVVAERIRTLGQKVDATLESFNKLNKIGNGNKDFKSEEMVKDLSKSHKILIEMLRNGILEAQKVADEGTADILITRTEAHEKHLWMLESSI